MEVTSTANRCKAITKAGEPCAGWAGVGSGFCFAHDPTKATERAAARVKGGRARHGRNIGITGADCVVLVGTPGDVLDVIRGAILDVLHLENSIARARTLGYLAGVALKAFEVTELEDRLTALEQSVGGERWSRT